MLNTIWIGYHIFLVNKGAIFARNIIYLHPSLINGRSRRLNLRLKVNVTKANTLKYSVSAMCCVLQVNRSTHYYATIKESNESPRIWYHRYLRSELEQLRHAKSKKSCKRKGNRYPDINWTNYETERIDIKLHNCTI